MAFTWTRVHARLHFNTSLLRIFIKHSYSLGLFNNISIYILMLRKWSVYYKKKNSTSKPGDIMITRRLAVDCQEQQALADDPAHRLDLAISINLMVLLPRTLWSARATCLESGFIVLIAMMHLSSTRINMTRYRYTFRGSKKCFSSNVASTPNTCT